MFKQKNKLQYSKLSFIDFSYSSISVGVEQHPFIPFYVLSVQKCIILVNF